MKRPESFLAFAVSADGTAERLTELPASNATAHAAYVWTHLHIQHDGAREWLEEEAKLDSTVTEALMAEEGREV